jgi:hypothetical protein
MPPQVRQYVITNRKGKSYTESGFQTQWKRAMTKAFPNVEHRFMFRDLRAKSISDAVALESALTGGRDGARHLAIERQEKRIGFFRSRSRFIRQMPLLLDTGQKTYSVSH